ncbi:MAG: DinB family protein [Phycicoccus sp.]
MPARFTGSDDLVRAEFDGVDLTGARFVETYLPEVVMRGVEVRGADIDAPWLADGGATFHVNGVDVAPLVEAELDRRFPGRDQRRATDPAGLRSAWAAAEGAWATAVERATAMPPGTVDVSVDGEWSFAQTLRHLVMTTDLWLRQAVLGIDRPFHPLGLLGPFAEEAGFDLSVLTTEEPTWAEVLDARESRVAEVRGFIRTVTPDELTVPRVNPWAPSTPKSTLGCLHVILKEEWEHLRFALRDLDTIEARAVAG